MFRFLEERYLRLRSDDIAALLGELTLLEDGKPSDPAIIRDWERAVESSGVRDPDTSTT
jgi:hypothetical protein